MEENFSEQDKLWVDKLVRDRNFTGLEEWIGDDPDRAREVFSQYRSLKTMEEMEAVLFPDSRERMELQAKTTGIRIKRVVVALLNQGLEILHGEEYRLLPQPGFIRSGEGTPATLDFGAFKLAPGKGGDYELRLGACHQVYVEEKDQGKRIYEAQRITGFTLPLEPGDYRVVIGGDSWDLELK